MLILIMEKTSKMLKYILSISLLIGSISMFGQKVEEQEKQKEPFDPGFAFGLNLGPFITRIYDDERTGFEATARFKYNRKWFAIGELGYENTSFDDKSYEYESNGSFLRLGFDYNFFKVEEFGNNDNVILGLRYGIGITEFNSNHYTISEGYWGDYEGSIPSTTSNAHWGEFVFGLRSEVLKNFYMGWSVRMRRLIAVNQDGDFEPYSIPGFGKRDNTTNLSFTYNLEYHLPFKKKRE